MIRMAKTYGARTRSPRPTTSGEVRRPVTARLTPEVQQKLNLVAEALGISVSATLSELVERLEVDEHHRPTWRSKYARTADDETQLELTA